MTERKNVLRKLVGRWTARAEEDFCDAGTLLSREPPGLGGAAFHSQQCAEKYLKAFLISHQVEFPKTHNIGDLLDLVAGEDRSLADSLGEATALNPHGVEVRYPSDSLQMSPALAKGAFELASKVRDAVRETLRGFLGEEGGTGPAV